MTEILIKRFKIYTNHNKQELIEQIFILNY